MQPFCIRKSSVIFYIAAMAVMLGIRILMGKAAFGTNFIFVRTAGIMFLTGAVVFGVMEGLSGGFELAGTSGRTQIFTPDMMAGIGVSLIFQSMVLTFISGAAGLIAMYLIRRVCYQIRKRKYDKYIGKKGAALQELSWEPGKYKGRVMIEDRKVKVIVSKESKHVPEGAKVRVTGMEGTNLVVARCRQ